MGKVYKDKFCDGCGTKGKVIEVWGKKWCPKCWEARPRGKKGHSGMIPMDELNINLELPFTDGLILDRTSKGNPVFATLYRSHYPKSRGIVGRTLNYFVKRGGDILGIIGGNSPPLNYKKFNEFFGKEYKEVNWINNNVYRLIHNEKNLGTKVLKMFRNIIKKDYEDRYNDTLIGMITFVEPPRTGAIYKADNWTYLGLTQGMSATRRNDHGKWVNKEWGTGTKKHIFIRWL